MYLDRKAEENFMKLTMLIENYDKTSADDLSSPKPTLKLGKLSKKPQNP